MKLGFSRQTFEKSSKFRYHENQSIGSRVVSYGQTNGQSERETELTKPKVAFRNFANRPEKHFQSMRLGK